MATLVRTKSLLHRVDLHGAEGGEYVTFMRQLDEPDEAQQRVVKLFWTDWEDLGSPDVVTVTIEPGDLLNVEET